MHDILTVKFKEEGLKEIQVFIGVTHCVLNDVLHIDFYRSMNAGNGSSLFLIDPKAATFAFNNRVIFICVPPNQRNEFYQGLFTDLYKFDVRSVVVTLHTKYTSPYTGETVSTGEEKYILDKELFQVYESVVDHLKQYKPFTPEDGDTTRELATVGDTVKEDIPLPGDNGKIRALAALEYLRDLKQFFYSVKNDPTDFYFTVFPKVIHDNIDGKVMIGTHMGYTPSVHDGHPLYNVVLKTKDGVAKQRVLFIDPYDCLEKVLQCKDVTLRFRDGSLYGADFNLADFEVEYYLA